MELIQAGGAFRPRVPEDGGAASTGFDHDAPLPGRVLDGQAIRQALIDPFGQAGDRRFINLPAQGAVLEIVLVAGTGEALKADFADIADRVVAVQRGGHGDAPGARVADLQVQFECQGLQAQVEAGSQTVVIDRGSQGEAQGLWLQ
ncbi:hypothetical protein D3C81_1696310 [compost metagenome]